MSSNSTPGFKFGLRGLNHRGLKTGAKVIQSLGKAINKISRRLPKTYSACNGSVSLPSAAQHEKPTSAASHAAAGGV